MTPSRYCEGRRNCRTYFRGVSVTIKKENGRPKHVEGGRPKTKGMRIAEKTKGADTCLGGNIIFLLSFFLRMEYEERWEGRRKEQRKKTRMAGRLNMVSTASMIQGSTEG